MYQDLNQVLAAEHRRDLLVEQDRSRLRVLAAGCRRSLLDRALNRRCAA